MKMKRYLYLLLKNYILKDVRMIESAGCPAKDERSVSSEISFRHLQTRRK